MKNICAVSLVAFGVAMGIAACSKNNPALDNSGNPSSPNTVQDAGGTATSTTTGTSTSTNTNTAPNASMGTTGYNQ